MPLGQTTTIHDVSRGVVVLGRLAPVVREGLLPQLREAFEILEVRGTVDDVLAEARRSSSVAAIVGRDDLAAVPELPVDILTLGISPGTHDILVVRRGDLDHLWNPTKQELVALIKRPAAAT